MFIRTKKLQKKTKYYVGLNKYILTMHNHDQNKLLNTSSDHSKDQNPSQAQQTKQATGIKEHFSKNIKYLKPDMLLLY